MSNHYIDDDFCEAWTINWDFNGFVLDYLYKVVDYYQYLVVSLTFLIDEDE